VEGVKQVLTFLAFVALAVPLGADTCLAPKNPVPAAVVCGRAFDQSGGTVADVELQLVSNQTVVQRPPPTLKAVLSSIQCQRVNTI
jgi:hypothetical protein